jgi:hypothetical protein
MPFIQVQNYVVRFGRQTNFIDPPTLVHYLAMQPLPFVGSGSAIDSVTFSYSLSGPTISVGQRNGRLVTGSFPLNEFDIHRTILQTEAPVFVDWIEDPATQPYLRSVVLRTDEEPPGEGPSDTS